MRDKRQFHGKDMVFRNIPTIGDCHAIELSKEYGRDCIVHVFSERRGLVIPPCLIIDADVIIVGFKNLKEELFYDQIFNVMVEYL